MTEQEELERFFSEPSRGGAETGERDSLKALSRSAEGCTEVGGQAGGNLGPPATGPSTETEGGYAKLEPASNEAAAELQRLSRRQLLRGGLAGGAAGLIVAAGTGAAAWQVAEAQGRMALEEANAEIARLQGLVALYEQLERINLDSVLQGGMAALALSLQPVEAGVRGLKAGLDFVEAAALSFREALPTAHEAILWLEERIASLAEGIGKVETALGQLLEKATSNPLADRLKEFAKLVLDNLPFGLGDKIRGVLDGLADLVTGIDDLLRGVNAQLLEPLRTKWFAQEEEQGVGAGLIDPLVTLVLDPLEAHLGALADLLDSWQNKLAAPVETALDDRATVLAEIVRYKQAQGL